MFEVSTVLIANGLLIELLSTHYVVCMFLRAKLVVFEL